MTANARVPGADDGSSLAEMAQRDLDAALQLLATRAQYITGATGAAIALRRHGRNDMLCRASAGSNAPELGALLSTEVGLSGESVRTGQLLRCDDAERDARVNREVCRQRGIASVVVMPVVNDDEVLGVFELFSGRTNAFGERDVSAVQRLSGMVETAILLARAAGKVPEQLKGSESSALGILEPPGSAKPEEDSEEILDEEIFAEAPVEALRSAPQAAASAEHAVESSQKERAQIVPKQPADPLPAGAVPAPADELPSPTPAKKLFWSAALSASAQADDPAEADQSHVPPVLRGLRKCEVCGFPITEGRVLCVECEEKKWRGQLERLAPARRAVDATAKNAVPAAKAEGQAFAAAAHGVTNAASASSPSASVAPASVASAVKPAAPAAMGNEKSAAKSEVASHVKPLPAQSQSDSAERVADIAAPTFAFSSGMGDSQSWFSRNKYVLAVLLVVAAAVAGFLFFR